MAFQKNSLNILSIRKKKDSGFELFWVARIFSLFYT